MWWFFFCHLQFEEAVDCFEKSLALNCLQVFNPFYPFCICLWLSASFCLFLSLCLRLLPPSFLFKVFSRKWYWTDLTIIKITKYVKNKKTLFTVTKTNVTVYVSIHLSVCCTPLCPSFPRFVPPPPPFFLPDNPSLPAHSLPTLFPAWSSSSFSLSLLPSSSHYFSHSFSFSLLSPSSHLSTTHPFWFKINGFCHFHLRKGLHTQEDFWNVHLCMTEFICPQVTCKVDGTSEIK